MQQFTTCVPLSTGLHDRQRRRALGHTYQGLAREFQWIAIERVGIDEHYMIGVGVAMRRRATAILAVDSSCISHVRNVSRTCAIKPGLEEINNARNMRSALEPGSIEG